jgi:hypothetical protein
MKYELAFACFSDAFGIPDDMGFNLYGRPFSIDTDSSKKPVGMIGLHNNILYLGTIYDALKRCEENGIELCVEDCLEFDNNTACRIRSIE